VHKNNKNKKEENTNNTQSYKVGLQNVLYEH